MKLSVGQMLMCPFSHEGHLPHASVGRSSRPRCRGSRRPRQKTQQSDDGKENESPPWPESALHATPIARYRQR